MTAKSFMSACRDFFGQKPGQSPIEFGKEVQKLSPKDKVEIAEGLRDHHGITVEPFPKAE